MMKRAASIVDWAREFMLPVLKEGGRALDATAGKGNDTLFLAEGVGKTGRVYALDIQAKALEQTLKRLETVGVQDRVTLVQENHANLAQAVDGELDAIMFNLGYLPGSDHRIKTNPADTLSALEQALAKLSQKGRMSVIVYTGHPGSGAEARVVSGFAASLSENYTVVKLCFWNGPRQAPELYLFSHSGVNL